MQNQIESPALFNDFGNPTERLQKIQDFEILKSSQSNTHPFKYFLSLDKNSNKDFWINSVESPRNNHFSGIVRFYDHFEDSLRNYLNPHLNNIPELLKTRRQWILVESEKDKLGSSLNSIVTSRGVSRTQSLDKKNWQDFCDVTLEICNSQFSLGFVTSNEELLNDLRLIVIKITKSSGYNYTQILNLWMSLGMPYLEHSSNSDGWVILGLVRKEFPLINNQGIKVFMSDDYIQLSGLGAIGQLKDITEEISSIHAYRFNSLKSNNINFASQPETPREIQILKDMLSYISADCSCEIYNRIIWSILSTQWTCAESIALEWSKSALDRFEETYFNNLVKNYDISKSPTYGSIKHFARTGGWNGRI